MRIEHDPPLFTKGLNMAPMIPILGTLDDCDAPEARMLVVVWGNPGRPNVEYVNPAIRSLRGRGPFTLARFTPLAAFGVLPELLQDGMLMTRQVDRSRAAYPDGKGRRWQGGVQGITKVRPTVFDQVKRAVFAHRAICHGLGISDAGTAAPRPAPAANHPEPQPPVAPPAGTFSPAA